MAEYIHAVRPRSAAAYYYGFTPQGQGRVWDCTTLGDKTMTGRLVHPLHLARLARRAGCAGSPTATRAGFRTTRPRPSRSSGTRRARWTWCSTWSAPRRPSTARARSPSRLQASPVKAMHDRWREDKWWCGDTFRQYAHNQNLIFASTPFARAGLRREVEEDRRGPAQGGPPGRALLHPLRLARLPGAGAERPSPSSGQTLTVIRQQGPLLPAARSTTT